MALRKLGHSPTVLFNVIPPEGETAAFCTIAGVEKILCNASALRRSPERGMGEKFERFSGCEAEGRQG
jgi:hypothetical protein